MHVLDANVFIHAPSPPRFGDAVTVPAVVEELESSDAQLNYGLEDVDVYSPGEEAVEEIREKAGEMGEDLSAADVQLLALALERDAVVVTDDYGVQNLASRLDIRYEPFLREGIEEEIEWMKVCEDCGEEVDGERCPVCGGDTRKVPGSTR